MNQARRSTDVVVVGGGIVGMCTALRLRRTGRSVTVVERSAPGDAASGHNGGSFTIGDCAPTGTPDVLRSFPRMLRDPDSPLVIRWRDLPSIAPWMARFALASRAKRVETISISIQDLMSRALDAYRSLVAGTESERLMHTGGVLNAFVSADAFAEAQFGIGLRSRRGCEFEVLDKATIDQRHPELAGRFEHAVYLPRAMFTDDPQALVRGLADTFVAEGGQVRTAEVAGFELRVGRVHAVATSGGRIPASEVVISAGPWSGGLLRKLGSSVPLGAERGYGIDLPDPGVSIDRVVVVSDYHIALTPHRTGIRIVGFDELAAVDAPARLQLIDRIIHMTKKVFPELRTEGSTRWMRSRPSMPDSLPVIGRAPRQDNVYLAFGHGHKGLCLGAVTGELVTQLVEGRDPSTDLTPFSPTRFGFGRRRFGGGGRAFAG